MVQDTWLSVVVELGSIVEALVALAPAASRAVERRGLGASTGLLRPSLDADVLVVEGDLAALQGVRQVVIRGQG